LKANNIPCGLMPLEELFDSDDVAKKPKMVPTKTGVENINIGIANKQKNGQIVIVSIP